MSSATSDPGVCCIERGLSGHILRRWLVALVLVTALGALPCPVLAAAAAPVEAVDYAAKIAPLFQEHCLDCHAADDPEGEFVVETFDGVMKGGKTEKAVIPGKANDSLLVKFLEGRSGKEGKNKFMPPGKHKHLDPAEITLIRQWIDAGAMPPAAPRQVADVLAALPKIKPTTTRPSAIHALAYSAKAGLLAAGSFGEVRLLDATTTALVRKLGDISGKVNALAFSPDGTLLFAAAGDAGLSGIAYEWKVADGTLVRKFEGHRDALYAVAISPDGSTLATGSYDQKIKLWKVADGSTAQTLGGHTGAVFGLSFRRDGKVLASASADRTVKLWSVDTGKRLDTFSQPLKEQNTVAFAPDGLTVAAAGVDSRVRVWTVSETAAEGSNSLLFTRFAHEGAVLNLVYSPDGKMLVSSASDKMVKAWRAADLTELQAFPAQPDWAQGVALLDAHRVAVGRLDGTLAFYDPSSGMPLAAQAPPKPAVKAMPPVLPEIIRLEPRGVRSGGVTRVKITGKNLAGLKGLKFSQAGFTGTIEAVDAAGAAAEVEIYADAKTARGEIEVHAVTPAGESLAKKLFVDSLPQMVAFDPPSAGLLLEELPMNIWGTLNKTGQQDNYQFRGTRGQTIIFDLTARRLDSKAQSPRLEIYDAAGKLLEGNNGLDSGSDPFIAFTASADGIYTVRVREITLEGSPDHAYRLTAGMLPYVTGWWPLSIPANTESVVHLVGHNLRTDSVTVKAGAEGEITLPQDGEGYRGRVPMRVAASDLPEVIEQEPNDTPATAQTLTIPSSVNGRLYRPNGAADADLYAFTAEAGQRLVLETRAAMLGSPADTKIEVLDAKGEPVPQAIFQATKDSWLALRSKDANEAGIRLGQFSEMELNDYMYFNGEILRIFRLARGPDADTVFFMRNGLRRAFFSTSPAAHGLDEPCYVVEPLPVGAKLVPNGLPAFTVNYANDDDGERQLGRDSRLLFTAPAQGRYFVRVTDARGWSGERYAYRLILRAAQPDFAASITAKGTEGLPTGSGLQFLVKADRQDGWEGDVRVDFAGVPDGFFVSSPLVVQAGHLTAAGSLCALPGARAGKADFAKMTAVATGTLEGKQVTHSAGAFPTVTVAPPPKQMLFLEPDAEGKAAGDGKSAPAQPYDVTITPGGRVSVWLRVNRLGNESLLSLDLEGLPHGVIVDSIGLNGVQIRANETEREVFLSCAAWVPEQDRLCHIAAGNAGANESVAGLQTSFPVLLKVRRAGKTLAAGER